MTLPNEYLVAGRTVSWAGLDVRSIAILQYFSMVSINDGYTDLLKRGGQSSKKSALFESSALYFDKPIELYIYVPRELHHLPASTLKVSPSVFLINVRETSINSGKPCIYYTHMKKVYSRHIN